MGGKSSSSASQSTNNIDKRVATESGTVIQDASNITVTDGGIVGDALNTVRVADALHAEGFEKLLGLAEKLTTKTQDTASGLTGRYTQDVLQGVTSLKASQEGRFQEQTIVILGIAGAVAAVAMAKKKGG